jgi:hypothetical protein
MRYDMLHVTPPQGPLDVVAQSPLANQDGWVSINTEVRWGGRRARAGPTAGAAASYWEAPSGRRHFRCARGNCVVALKRAACCMVRSGPLTRPLPQPARAAHPFPPRPTLPTRPRCSPADHAAHAV